MNKIVRAEKNAMQKIGADCACYVLISCTRPDANGQMEVQMNYEGDESLASFLVASAVDAFDQNGERKSR
jgi:hypothetical protein